MPFGTCCGVRHSKRQCLGKDTELQQGLAGWEQLYVGLAVCGYEGNGAENMDDFF